MSALGLFKIPAGFLCTPTACLNHCAGLWASFPPTLSLGEAQGIRGSSLSTFRFDPRTVSFRAQIENVTLMGYFGTALGGGVRESGHQLLYSQPFNGAILAQMAPCSTSPVSLKRSTGVPGLGGSFWCQRFLSHYRASPWLCTPGLRAQHLSHFTLPEPAKPCKQAALSAPANRRPEPGLNQNEVPKS